MILYRYRIYFIRFPPKIQALNAHFPISDKGKCAFSRIGCCYVQKQRHSLQTKPLCAGCTGAAFGNGVLCSGPPVTEQQEPQGTTECAPANSSFLIHSAFLHSSFPIPPPPFRRVFSNIWNIMTGHQIGQVPQGALYRRKRHDRQRNLAHKIHQSAPPGG